MASRAPTIRQRRLAAALRRLRLERDLTAEDIADDLAWSQSKISRIETARIGVRPSDVRLLLELYGVDESYRGEIMALAHAAQEKPWWADYVNDIGEGYAGFIAVEDEADTLFCFEQSVVPGLLQTEEYARRVIAWWSLIESISAPRMERVLQVRLRRQQVLLRERPLQFTAVLDESVLLRRTGSNRTMLEQMDKLVEIVRLPNVEVRILPLDVPRYGLSGGFQLITFSPAYDIAFPSVIFTETAFGSQSEDESLSHAFYLIRNNMLLRSLDSSNSIERILRIKEDVWARVPDHSE